MKTTLDLYIDYLLNSFGATTATGLSDILDGAISHNEVTRFVRQLPEQIFPLAYFVLRNGNLLRGDI